MTTAVGLLEAWFDHAAELFETAVARAGAGPDRDLRVAGHATRLRFAGQALGPVILPALQHLPGANGSTPDLTIRLWDLKSTHTTLTPPPWDAVEYHERGNTRAWNDERFSLSYDRKTDVFSAVDSDRRVALYWTRDAAALPNYTSAAPMHRLLQGWLGTKQLFLVHAAAIGLPDGGLLLAGRSGSGKSTTATLSLESDLLYAGDDFALVRGGPEPRVYGLYATAKLNVDALDRMPALRSAVSNPTRLDREKALLFLADGFRPRLAIDLPLRAIVLPRVTGRRETEITPASPFAAYRASGPDTAFTMLGDARGLLRMLKDLVYRLPCYELGLGTDRGGVQAALHDILSLGVTP